jgi:DNA uptake protein ComE-like DNA-binding protein
MVLVVVLVAIALLSLAGYTFAQLMFAEREAATSHGRAVQARASVDSAAAWIEQQLAMPGAIDQRGGWYDNPTLFRRVLVSDSDDDRARARFTVLSPRWYQGAISGIRYGLEDESGRLNLNTLLLLDPVANSGGGGGGSGGGSTGGGSSGGGSSGSTSSSSSPSNSTNPNPNPNGQAALMELPGMTLEIADAILDWLDADDEPRAYGCERSYYSGLNPPYAPKNGAFSSVEELLLVRGVTPQMLFGPDADRNGFIDAQEAANGMGFSGSLQTGAFSASSQSGSGSSGSSSSGSSSGSSSSSSGGSSSGSSSTSSPVTLPSGAMNQGWSAYLTVYSQESNLRPDGQLKVNLNQSDLSLLNQQVSAVLGADVATFIVAFRQGSPQAATQSSQSTAQSASGVTLDYTKPGNTMFASPADLIGVQVTAQSSNSSGASGGSSTLVSPFTADPAAIAGYASRLFDNLTIVPTATVPGRINAAQASMPVLMGIPGMDSQTALAIQSAQQSMPSQSGSSSMGTSSTNSDRRYSTWLLAEGIVPLNMYQKMAPYLVGGGRVFRSQIVGHFDRGGPLARAELIIDATNPVPRIVLWREMGHLGRGFPDWLLR